MDIVGTIKKSWFHPREFFASLSEASVMPAWKHYAICSLVYVVLFALIFASLGAVVGSLIPGGAALGAIFGSAFAIAFYIAMLIGIFISAAIMHIFVYLVGGRAGYGKTFQALAYGSTPGLLLGWIPLVGIIFSLWSIYNYLVGLSTLHRMTMGKALMALLIPIIIAIVVGFLFGFTAALSAIPAY